MIERIVNAHFGNAGGELQVGGLPIGEIARRHGTPLFVYDRDVMAARVSTLREALPPRFDLYYSIKANPNQAILKYFISQGCGLEIASGGELYQTLAAGCEPGRVLFAGPGKTEAELEYALASGIGEIHAESRGEIRMLATIGARLGVRVRTAIRVNPAAEAQGGAMRMGGTASPFGVDEEMLDDVLDQLLGETALEFCGIHLFVGTQILDHEVLIRQYRKGFEIGKRAARRAGKPLATLDFGGGLGIPYFPNERPLDVTRFGEELQALVAEQAEEPELSGTRFVLEPGRHLVGESGIYVVRVTAVKQSRDRRYAVVDGGMNHHLAASGNLGQVIKRNFPCAVLNRLDDPPAEPLNVVGPLCTPLDVLAREAPLPQVAVGDLVGVFQSGAYARTASPLGFLSHAAPPEVLVHDGRATRIRRRAEHEELLHDQCDD